MWFALLGTLEQGLVYGLMALGVYITFRILDFPDLTVDGSFPMGAAVAAMGLVSGVNPFLTLVMATLAGAAAGAITGLLHTKLKISGLLSGILTMTALYSINLRIMGGRPNIPLLRVADLFDIVVGWGISKRMAPVLVFVVFCLLGKLALDWFLHSQLGLAMRATGDNEQMLRSLGGNTDTMKLFGLILANAFVGLSGGLVAQYQGFADANLGIGMIVSGLASVIIGEVLLRPQTVVAATLGAVIGSVIYRLVIFVALRVGLAPTDLKLMTAVLVVFALSGGTLQTLWQRIRSPKEDKEAVGSVDNAAR